MEIDPDACPIVRPDLRFSPRDYAGEDWVVVEDPATDRWYRIGADEYAFLRRFDGLTTLAQAVRAEAAERDRGLDEHDALTTYQWLRESGIVQDELASAPAALEARGRQGVRQRTIQRLNPVLVRIPLFDPDAILDHLYPWLRGLTGPVFFSVWITSMVHAGYLLVTEWSAVRVAASQVVAPENWLWLVLAWLGLKVVHELSHGLMCKRYGGHCREAGVFLILFLPLAYVDVSSTWRFASRWPRVAVAAAGMYIELFVASLALWLWVESEPGVVRSLAYDVALVASVGSLLFNANFLMRFDGYHLVSDGLAIPNLYAHGQRFVGYLANRYLFGQASDAPAVPGKMAWFVRSYGVAAALWRALVLMALLFGASLLAEGAGVVLAMAAALVWFGPPIVKFLRRFQDSASGSSRLYLRRVLPRVALVAALGWWMFGLSVSSAVSVPAVVTYQGAISVRLGSAGRVTKVAVREGDQVDAGAVLVRLENPELELQLALARLELEAFEIEGRALRGADQVVAYRTLRERIAVLEERVAWLEHQVADLVLEAPRGGEVVGANLDVLEGQSLSAGVQVLEIVDEARKELVLSAREDDATVLRSRPELSVYALHWDVPGAATIDRVAPKASAKVEQGALAASNGGPLAVVGGEHGIGVGSGSAEGAMRYTEARVRAYARLDETSSRRLHAGQWVRVRYAGRPRTLGERASTAWQAWKDEVRAAARALRG